MNISGGRSKPGRAQGSAEIPIFLSHLLTRGCQEEWFINIVQHAEMRIFLKDKTMDLETFEIATVRMQPVIAVMPVRVIRSKGLDDQGNPHRGWNTTGDWKRHA